MKYKFTKNGWITEKGKFIPCKWAQHYYTLSHLSRTVGLDELKAELLWLKISDNAIIFFFIEVILYIIFSFIRFHTRIDQKLFLFH